MCICIICYLEIYDQCNPSNALDYEDADNFMIPQGSPNVRLTTTQYARQPQQPRYPRGGASRSGGDKRSALLGDPEEDEGSVRTPPPPPADPFFKLVPSSSSSLNGSPVPPPPAPDRSVLRRPPAPTAANTTSAAGVTPLGSPTGSSKFNKWPAPGTANKNIDWREEMKRFYIAIGMPEKIAGISTILSTWAGKEEQMLASLMEKYRTSIPTQMSVHLEQLLSHLETHTESSFVKGPAISANASVASPSLPKSPQRNAVRRNKPSPARANL